MQKDIFIHIGTHKTGTTSIQETLMKNANALRKESVKFINLYNFEGAEELKFLENADEELSQRLRLFFKSRIEEDIQKYIVCCEYLSGNPKSLYSNVSQIAEVLYNSLDDFEAKKIVAVLRHQEQFIQSIYTQYLHQGETLEVNSFMNKSLLPNIKWTNFLKTYETIFGVENVFAVPYDKTILERKNLINLLGEYANINALKTLSLDNHNQGYNKKAAEIAKACNPHLSNSENKILRSLMQKHLHKPVFSRYQLLSKEQVVFLNNYFKEDNEKLFENYFNGFGIASYTVSDDKDNVTEHQKRDSYVEVIVQLVKELDKRPKENVQSKSPSLKTKIKKVIKQIIGG